VEVGDFVHDLIIRQLGSGVDHDLVFFLFFEFLAVLAHA
jgi:hypothetical protein